MTDEVGLQTQVTRRTKFFELPRVHQDLRQEKSASALFDLLRINRVESGG